MNGAMKGSGGLLKPFLLIVLFFVLHIAKGTPEKPFSGNEPSINYQQVEGITVKGKVIDETGMGLPGVTILIKGTTEGTVTSFEGLYNLTVPSRESVLVFTSIGMASQEITVGEQTVINITMTEDMKELEEVIVVAYGTTTQEKFTGSAEVVDSEIIEKRVVTSFDKALQGAVPGLKISSASGQPGSGTSVTIRGVGSLSAGNSPLYVIDGVPMVSGGYSSVASSSNALSTLNPNDIESITVLKDASASSLYGSRAANGVIIVTTKKGNKGQTRLKFEGQLGVSELISKGYELMGSADYYKMTWDGLYHQKWLDGATLAEAGQFANENIEGVSGWNPYNIDEPFDIEGNLKPGAELMIDEDWREVVLRQGITQNYNLTASGGSDNTRFYMAGSYFSQDGVVIGSDFERITGRFNFDHQAYEFLKLGLNTTVSNSVQNSPPSGSAGANPVRSANLINSATPVYLSNGDYNWENQAAFDFNPVGLAERDIYQTQTFRLLTNGFLEATFLKDFKYKLNASLDFFDINEVQYFNPDHGNGAGVNGRSIQIRNNNRVQNITHLLTWAKGYGNHFIDALVGYETFRTIYDGVSASATDFAIPDWPHLVGGSNPETPSSSITEYALKSYFTRVNYDYLGKYYLSLSFRIDGSSRFGENNKYGKFYSVGGSWNITEEGFLKGKYSWLDYLKLRSSYGISGNDNIGNFGYMSLYYLGANYSGNPGLAAGGLANPDLQWEGNSIFNVALDFNLFGNVAATIEYYTRGSDELLYSEPISLSKGFASTITNLGSMKNRGLEFNLTTTNINKQDFVWTTNFNLSANRNEIIDIGQEEIKTSLGILRPGSGISTLYLREWAGVNPDSGQPMWYTNSGSRESDPGVEPVSAYADPLGSGKMVTSEYNDAARVVVGTGDPQVYGGLTNQITWKGFDLNFLFYYSLGWYRYNSGYAANMHDGSKPGNNLAQDALYAWTPDNKYTNVPRYVAYNTDNGNQTSTRFLEQGDYIRLKNITLSYNLPKRLAEAAHLYNVRFYTQAENLFTWTSYKGFDPEGSSTAIPAVRSVTLGVDVEF